MKPIDGDTLYERIYQEQHSSSSKPYDTLQIIESSPSLGEVFKDQFDAVMDYIIPEVMKATKKYVEENPEKVKKPGWVDDASLYFAAEGYMARKLNELLLSSHCVLTGTKSLMSQVEEIETCLAMEVDDLCSLDGICTEESIELYDWLNGAIEKVKYKEETVKEACFFTVVHTPGGKFLFECEEGGYYSINWERGKIEWSKIL